MTFHFTITSTDNSSRARTGKVTTAHGEFPTPVFMPVGTRATVKTMTPRDLKEVGTTILLGNTYHLALRPSSERIKQFGGLHSFMAWDGPILTDSGGFQVFSLAKLRKMSEDGVTFRSHIDGSKVEFTPEIVMEIEKNLGSDIVMPLDHCIEWPCTKEEAEVAMQRSIRWLQRSKEYDLQPHQSLFAIVQGSCYEDLRKYCAQEMANLDLPGYALGGLAVGETKQQMAEVIAYTEGLLPWNKPRYLMGVGMPDDIVTAVSLGVDMFDCVIPTRNARNGCFFTWQGKKQIRNSCFREDFSPLDADCPCYACSTFTRGYLHHLFSKKVEEILGLSMLTLHNLTFFHELMKRIRESIENGNFIEFKDKILQAYRQNNG